MISMVTQGASNIGRMILMSAPLDLVSSSRPATRGSAIFATWRNAKTRDAIWLTSAAGLVMFRNKVTFASTPLAIPIEPKAIVPCAETHHSEQVCRSPILIPQLFASSSRARALRTSSSESSEPSLSTGGAVISEYFSFGSFFRIMGGWKC
jgi:hypothetical protein